MGSRRARMRDRTTAQTAIVEATGVARTAYFAASLRIAPPLCRSLQNLHQLGMHELVAADDVAGLDRIVMARHAGDEAAGLAHDDLAGCDVPGLQIVLPIAVEPAGGDEGEVERCRAETAEPCDLVLDL